MTYGLSYECMNCSFKTNSAYEANDHEDASDHLVVAGPR